MKKLFIVTLFSTLILSISAHALAQAMPAIVINDAPGGCGALGYDDTAYDSPFYPYVLVPSETGKRLVATYQGNVLILTCTVDGVPNSTGRAIVDIVDWIYRDFGMRLPCSTRFEGVQYFTHDAHSSLTPNGIAHTTCRFEFP